MATATKTLSKTRQVINHLRSGKSLTRTQAESKFGVKNIRAMVSSIREQFERYGNWMLETDTNSRGETVYRLTDIHPGQRVWGFDAQGNRYRL